MPSLNVLRIFCKKYRQAGITGDHLCTIHELCFSYKRPYSEEQEWPVIEVKFLDSILFA